MKLTAPIKAKLMLLFVDMSFLVTAMSLATWIRLGHPLFIFYEYRGGMSFCLMLYPVALYFARAYEVLPQTTLTGSLRRPVLGLALASLLASFFFYFALHWRFGRGIFVIMNFLFFIFLMVWRSAFYWDSRRRRFQVLMAGEGEHLVAASQILREHLHEPEIRFLDGNAAPVGSGGPHQSGLDGRIDGDADLIILAGHNITPLVARIAAQYKFRGVPVWDLPRLYSELAERLPAHHIGDLWLATAEGFQFFSKHTVKYLKRFSDVLVAAFGMTLSFPLLLLAVALIKLEDGGEVLYSQERIGLEGRPFWIYKLRTMVTQAEKETGPVWSTEGDPRITKVGCWLRKTRVDEIPQMWNVLRGDMSFVGPRPERPVFVKVIQEKYPIYSLRHLVRPGITGWAQVKYSYGSSEEDTLRKLEYDLYYIQNFSLLFDLRILLKTVSVVVSGWGGR